MPVSDATVQRVIDCYAAVVLCLKLQTQHVPIQAGRAVVITEVNVPPVQFDALGEAITALRTEHETS